MMSFSLTDFLAATGAKLLRGDDSLSCTGVSTDSRRDMGGRLFLALSGPNFDGNLFASAAVAAGAGALLLRGDAKDSLTSILAGQEDSFLRDCKTPILVHPNPRRALADFATYHRSELNIPVVGITGSCGKTTVKNILHQLLSEHMRCVASPASYNNDIGVPLTLLGADEQSEALVVEIGTNSPGEIASLCRIARPTAGVITSIGVSHLQGLGSIEGVAHEKADLARSLPPGGFLVLPADCRFHEVLRSGCAARVITFSVEGEGDLNASDLVFHGAGSSLRVNGFEVTFGLLGNHNVQNLLAALATCLGLGFELEALLPSISRLKGGRQRMERIELGELCVLDDSYNSNPDSASAAVRVLSGLHGHARRVLVLGDMLELGDQSANLHRAIGREAGRADLDLLITVGAESRQSAAGACKAGMSSDSVLSFDDVASLELEIKDLVRAGDVVLVKGSRGMHLERLVGRLREWAQQGVA